MKRIVGIAFLVCLYCANKVQGQDAHFSQFYKTPLLLNPSLAGEKRNHRLIANHRNQWKNALAQYKTYNFSFDMLLFPIKKDKGSIGVGVNFLTDKAGDTKLKTDRIDLAGAVQLKVHKKHALAAGFGMAFSQRKLDAGALQSTHQYDGKKFDSSLPHWEVFDPSRALTPEIGTGLSWIFGDHEKYISANNQFRASAGYSLLHVLRNVSFMSKKIVPLHLKHTGHFELEMGIKNTDIVLAPRAVYFKQGPHQQVTAGMEIIYLLVENSKYTDFVKNRSIGFGGYYRVNDALVLTLKLDWANTFLSFSYDINLSAFTPSTTGRGGFELGLGIIDPTSLLKVGKNKSN